MEALIQELKEKIIETINLEGVVPDDIEIDEQLVGGELGIDSIDVLELVLMLERDYAVVVKDRELGAKVFASLRSMAEYIQEHSPRAKG
ncbi:MAG: acyl carrier protein [Deltaproteobacteria bacterium SG8_13]|nr:MAG: acyl carrier protein [Deltaproteobacteria bacterium SG8_13]